MWSCWLYWARTSNVHYGGFLLGVMAVIKISTSMSEAMVHNQKIVGLPTLSYKSSCLQWRKLNISRSWCPIHIVRKRSIDVFMVLICYDKEGDTPKRNTIWFTGQSTFSPSHTAMMVIFTGKRPCARPRLAGGTMSLGWHRNALVSCQISWLEPDQP